MFTNLSKSIKYLINDHYLISMHNWQVLLINDFLTKSNVVTVTILYIFQRKMYCHGYFKFCENNVKNIVYL